MKTAALQEAVGMVIPSIDHKGLVESFGFLHFRGGCIEATDGAMLARAALEEKTPTFSIPAGTFHALLKTVVEPDIDLVIEDDKLVLKTKRIHGKLMLPGEIKSVQLDFDPPTWQDIPASFMTGLSLCRFTACPDQTSGALTGVRVTSSGALSCDRFRVSRYSFGGEDGKNIPAMTVPVSLIDQVTKQASKLDKYAMHNDTLYFKFKEGKVILAAKVLKGDYPEENLNQAFKLLSAEGWIDIPLTEAIKDQITNAVERQNLIQSELLEFDRSTQFSYDKGKIKLFSSNQLVGSIEEVIEDGCASDLIFSFFVNPIFLLKAFEEADILKYSKTSSMAVFSSDKFKHLIKTRASQEKK